MARKTRNTDFKINKYYKDESDMKVDSAVLSLDKIRYGIIKHGDVINISIDNEKMAINGSWVGLILLMIETYYYNIGPLIEAKQVNFIVNLVQGGVISKGLDITNTYGLYDDDNPYTAYKILNTPYWLETNGDVEAIFKALTSLAKLLSIKYSSFELKIVRKKAEKSDLGLRNFELEVTEVWTTVKDLKAELKSSIKVSKMNLFGEVVPITSLFDGIAKLVDLIFKVYSMDALQYIVGNTGTGVTTKKNLPGFTVHEINNIDYSEIEDFDGNNKLILYTNNSIDNQVEFLIDLCDNLDSLDDIKIALIKMIAKAND